MDSFYNREAGKHLRGADLASDYKSPFEFKEVFVMPIGRLRQLDSAMIEVEVDVQGRVCSLRGQGIYDADDPDLGPVLRILVSDPRGDFEFLLAESKWEGPFNSSKLPGCDYRISFTNSTVC